MLRLIRRYLQAELMTGGVATVRGEGMPQGGPLSPLLSNIQLDDLDKEIERRGHSFCRYADDCNIYVRSMRAGQRVMASIAKFLDERLKLSVNAKKSAVDFPWNRTFLGYTISFADPPRLRVADVSVKRFRSKLKRTLFHAGRGCNLEATIENLTPVLRGWIAYFRYSDVKGTFEELDKWIRRRLRLILWRHWKTEPTRKQNLISRGVNRKRAGAAAHNGFGPWRNAGGRHMNFAFQAAFFEALGLMSLLKEYRRLNHTPCTAVYGTVRTLVWEGESRGLPLPDRNRI